jgi:chromosome segregation ATPase
MTLDEKVEAILSLCTTMAVQIQKNTDEIKELRSDVTELRSDVTELRSDVRRLGNRMESLEHRMESLEKGQKRIDERLAIMTDQIAGNHSRTKSIEERLMINDQRIQRLEDRIFPALAEAV